MSLILSFFCFAPMICYYTQAARKFVDVSPELGSSFDGVVAPEDIAVYGGLCALATFSRSEMKRRVLENTSFKNFLDLVPQVCDIVQQRFVCLWMHHMHSNTLFVHAAACAWIISFILLGTQVRIKNTSFTCMYVHIYCIYVVYMVLVWLCLTLVY